MSKKNKQRNAFYWYMQDLIQELRREGRVFPNGIQDVVPIANPRWKTLSKEDKEPYEKKAKEERKKLSGSKGDQYRLDNQGNIISERKEATKETEKRRQKESRIMKSRWPEGLDIIHEKFYFVAFEYLCETEEKDYLPVEVGMVEFSLNDGITKTLQKFIKPGKIPIGYRYTCQSHSDSTHNIPLEGHKKSDSNYLGIWNQMENFVNPNKEKREYPPLFVLESDMGCAEYCLEWIFRHSCLGKVNCLEKVFELETMVVNLFHHLAAAEVVTPISLGQAIDLLTTSTFDYENNTRCDWHEEQEVKYCALGTVKRYAFALADALADPCKIELIPNRHLPARSEEPNFIVLSPSSIQMDYKPIPNKLTPSNRSATAPSWTPSSQNGGYASRDVRYFKAENSAEPDDLDDEFDPPEPKFSETMRRPNIPAVVNQMGPAWSAAGRGVGIMGLPGGQEPGSDWPSRGVGIMGLPGGQEPSDWPSLGAKPDKPKYAGRASAPPPTHAPPPPSTWQSKIQGGAQYAGGTPGDGPQPYVEHVKTEDPPQKPTIHQAVQRKEAEQIQQIAAPSVGPRTQFAKQPVAMAARKDLSAPRQVNAGRRGGLSQAGAPAVGRGRSVPLSGAPAAGPGGLSQSGGSPARNLSAPRQVSSGWRPGSTSQAGKKPPVAMSSQSATPLVSNPDVTPPSSDSTTQAPRYDAPQRAPMAMPLVMQIAAGRGQQMTGLGRGRGIWNPAATKSSAPSAVPGGATAPPANSRLPPGLGRGGVTTQMADMNLGSYHQMAAGGRPGGV